VTERVTFDGNRSSLEQRFDNIRESDNHALMNDTILTVTEAARAFADCVNRAHDQRQSFLLTKNGVAFARLIPAGNDVCTGAELAKALAGARLPKGGAEAWRRELREARRRLKCTLRGRE